MLPGDPWSDNLFQSIQPRVDSILRHVYFRVVQRTPWIGFRSGWGYGSSSGNAEGAFICYSIEHHLLEQRLVVEWRADAGEGDSSTLDISVDLIASGTPRRRLWETAVRSENGLEGFGPKLSETLDLLEARAGEFEAALEKLLPVLPSIFDHPVSKAFPDPLNYSAILEWARPLMLTDREDEAKALLPIIAAIRVGNADSKRLEFGRRACMLLSYFRFTNCGNHWDPGWYVKLGVQALEFASKSLRLNAGDRSALVDRGSLRVLLQDHEGAVEDYSEALLLDSTDAEVYSLRASVLGELGRLESALGDSERAVEFSGGNDRSLYGRAMVLHDLSGKHPQSDYLERSVADLRTIRGRTKEGAGRFRFLDRNLERFEKDLQESRKA